MERQPCEGNELPPGPEQNYVVRQRLSRLDLVSFHDSRPHREGFYPISTDG